MTKLCVQHGDITAHVTHFRSCDIKHMILRKTSLTHLFFLVQDHDVISNEQIHKSDTLYKKTG